MALTYQPQHRAWKDRVKLEIATAARSPRSLPKYRGLPPLWTDRSFPTSETPRGRIRVKGLRDKEVNLGYTFGGFTSARFAFKDTLNSRNQSFPQKRYESEVKKLITEERRKQEELQAKLTKLQLSSSRKGI